MDVDTTTAAASASATAGGGGEVATRSIKIHPLAIIGISDHHTRVVSGGSALPPEAPVVGLLFGYYSNDGGGSGEFIFVWGWGCLLHTGRPFCCLYIGRFAVHYSDKAFSSEVI